MCISDVEQFLNENTFYCQPYKARISHQACKIQSARAYVAKLEQEQVFKKVESWRTTGDSTLRLQAILHTLPYACLRCEKYQEPDMDTSRKTLKKLLPLFRKPFGRFSNEKGCLSRTSPISDSLSELYHQTT